MITTVCLNPALDKSAEVDGLRLGEVNRLKNIRLTVGGKGINVAVVLSRLQAGVGCISLIGDADERAFKRAMEQEYLRFQTIHVSGNVRTNLKIFDTETSVVTECNEQGAQVDEKAINAVIRELTVEAGNSSYIALCGSLPPGCDADTYKKLMQTIPEKKWVVDTTGMAMRQALKRNPYLIKPNLPELEELIGRKLPTRDAVQEAAVQLCGQGIEHVAVSLGGDGAILTNGERTVFMPAVQVTVKSTVGAGDAMLAGLLYGLDRGETVFESLRYGAAAGAACVQGGGVHYFQTEVFQSLLTQTEIIDL